MVGQKAIQKPTKNYLGRRRLVSDILRDKQLYLMLIPFLAYYIIFHYVPLYGLQIAFKDYRPFLGIGGSPWVGLTHFKNFFTGPYAWRLIRNTFLISFYCLIIETPLKITLAILLNEVMKAKFKSFAQTILYMPHFISTVVVAGLVTSLIAPSGPINTLIELLGGDRTYFLADPKYFRTIYVIMNSWQGVGFGTIMYTSAIYAIDDSLYEAAEIDGAGRFGKMWHITLPGILPMVVTMLIMNIGKLLSVGSDAILLLYQPITYETADVISTYVYRYGLEKGSYSYSTAVGLFNGVVAVVLVTTANKISKKVTETSLW